MDLVELTVDGRRIAVPSGTKLIDAAALAGREIPSMCLPEGGEHFTSCMICLVEEKASGRLLPACSAPVEAGMVVETKNDRVRRVRKAAVELLLGDHVGDCEALCVTACPAHMDIPRMIREIQAGRFLDAIATIKETLAMPAVTARICPAPCEKACRRGRLDEPVAICLLKRFAADWDLAGRESHAPPRRASTGRKIAVVGAGPAGLSAAWHLAQAGHECEIWDAGERPGGALRSAVPESRLPRSVLDAEIECLLRVGVEVRSNVRVGQGVSLDSLRANRDAVVLAVGPIGEAGNVAGMDLARDRRGLRVDPSTWETSEKGIFAVGAAVHPVRMAVRALADGRELASSLDRLWNGGSPQPWFCFQTPNLQPGELVAMSEGCGQEKVLPAAGPDAGYSAEEASLAALRCLGCDCKAAKSCRLRRYAAMYGAEPKKYRGSSRRQYRRIAGDRFVYEPGKCILCGLCVHEARKSGETSGLAFLGRGFETRVGVPLAASDREGWEGAQRCAKVCPTGALVER